MTIDKVNGTWQLPVTITNVTDNVTEVKEIIETKDTYVDGDIQVTVKASTPAAVLSVTDSGTLSTTITANNDNQFLSSVPTVFPIVIDVNASISDIDIGVEQAGYIHPDDSITIESTSQQQSNTFYIKEGSLSNTETIGKEYTTSNSPTLISGKGLYINEGYLKDTYIPLADLVPDAANVIAGENGDSKYIYNTISVYDKDGTLIAGTMEDSTFDLHEGNVSTTDASAIVNTNITVSGNHNIASGILTVPPASDYITIGTTTNTIAGSASIDAVASATTGYVVEDTTTTKTFQENVNVAKTEATNKYIAVFNGQYSFAEE